MTDATEEIIRDIAAKHGVAIGRNDPILVLHTLNERLMQDNQASQQAMLDQFKSEIEAIAFQWGEDARIKAERTLNAALLASKQNLKVTAQTIERTIAESAKTDLAMKMENLGREIKRFQLIALLNLVTIFFGLTITIIAT